MTCFETSINCVFAVFKTMAISCFAVPLVIVVLVFPRRLMACRKCFRYYAAKCWNALPDNIRILAGTKEFVFYVYFSVIFFPCDICKLAVWLRIFATLNKVSCLVLRRTMWLLYYIDCIFHVNVTISYNRFFDSRLEVRVNCELMTFVVFNGRKTHRCRLNHVDQ